MKDKKSNVVFVHGFLSGSEYWHKQIDFLGNFFDTHTLDLPGFGQNCDAQPLKSIVEYAEYVYHFLKENNLTNTHFIGHSMGGMIAQEFVNRYPQMVNKLILYGTGPYGSMPGRFEPIEDSISKASINNFHDDIRNTVGSWFLDKEKSFHFDKSFKLAKCASFSAYISCLKAMKNWNGEINLNNINQKTLIIWADNDRSYKWEEQPYKLWKTIKNSHLAVIPNAAHNLHIEKPDIFNSIVKDFLL